MFIVVGKFGALSTAIIIVTTTFPFPIPIRQMIRRVPTVFARIVCVRKTKTKLRIVHRSHCAVNETSKGLGHIFFRLPLPPAEDSLQGSPRVPSFFRIHTVPRAHATFRRKLILAVPGRSARLHVLDFTKVALASLACFSLHHTGSNANHTTASSLSRPSTRKERDREMYIRRDKKTDSKIRSDVC